MTKMEKNRGNSAVTLAGPPIRLNFVSCVIQVHAEETFFSSIYLFFFFLYLSVMFCTLVSSHSQTWAGPDAPAAHVLVLGAGDTLTRLTRGKFLWFQELGGSHTASCNIMF